MPTLTVRCGSCKELLVLPEENAGTIIDCPKCGGMVEVPMQIQRPASAPKQGNICPRCNTIMLLIEKPKGTSVGGVFGAILFAFGLLGLLGNPLIGIVLMILGLLLSVVSRGKKLVLLCPSCKYEKAL